MSQKTDDQEMLRIQDEDIDHDKILNDTDTKFEAENELLYRVDENPPLYLALVLGFQHYLTMFGATFGVPFVIAVPLCFKDNPTVISEVLNTIIFVSGLATLFQTTLGVRLPIVQGCSFAFIAPTFAVMSIRGSCPSSSSVTTMSSATVDNGTFSLPSMVTTAIIASGTAMPNVTSTPVIAATEEEWKIRMREIQGAIMVSALFQVILGFSGILGFFIKFIGPLTIAPTIALVGLPLFETAYHFAGTQWGISLLMMALVTLFSQVLKNYDVPFPTFSWSQKKCNITRLSIFKIFPIMLAIIVCWIFCAILTAAGVFTDDPNLPSYKARTDARIDVLYKVDWFRVPYPGQWGTPTVSVASLFGMLAGALASMVESIGDYFACARLAGAPPPPRHAFNRGLGVEGICCILTGAWGTGNGTTSYSENIGAIAITRVGSRRVIQCGALIMIVLGVIGKFGALFTTIPDPVIGGIFIIMLGMIIAVGLSNLQYVDLNSIRNLFVLGVSLFFGLVLPFWFKKNPKAINTGIIEIDQIVTVLVSTNMAVGGITGFILDNILPGTIEERGLLKWRSLFSEENQKLKSNMASIHTYDIPYVTKFLQKFPFVRYIPFLPYYHEDTLLKTNDNGEDTPLRTNDNK